MSSDEARIAEAISSLTTQLESWGADEAPSKADLIVKELLRAGWRPRAKEVWKPTPGGEARCDDSSPHSALARAGIRAAKELASTPAPEDIADRTQEDAHE